MRIRREQLVFLVLAMGFFTLAFEVRHLHRDVLHEQWQAFVPIYYAIAAILGSVAALTSSGLWRSFAAAVFGIGIVVGMAGLYFHSDGDATKLLRPFLGTVVAHAGNGDDDERRAGREEESAPPPLAPMGITGLASIGLILAWPNKKRN